MKKFAFILPLFLFLCAPRAIHAESRQDRRYMPHEIRLGWGDQMFETLMWHEPRSIITTTGPLASYQYCENYRYFQHLFLEYQYRVNHWFGVGVQFDGSGFDWDNVTRDGYGKELYRNGDDNQSEGRHYCYNIMVMPTIRFTYFHHDNVNIYTALGAGIIFNAGTETNMLGHKTDVGMALDLALLGVSANYQRYFAAVELGGLTGLRDTNNIYLAFSSLFRASIGVRF